MATSPVVPIRPHNSTETLAQRVFTVCDTLWEEYGEDFTNNQVLEQSKGGNAAVGALVKIYRKNRGIVEANKALTSDVTIGLVRALDSLLQNQVAQSQQAVDSFMSTSAVEITELAVVTEQQQATIDRQAENLTRLEETVRTLETTVARQKAETESLERSLRMERDAVTHANNSLRHKEDLHRAKLEQVNSEHRTSLATSLECQRKAMIGEQKDALDAQRQELTQTLNDMRTELTAATDTQQLLQQKLDTQREENSTLILDNTRLAEGLHRAESIAEEQQTAIWDARRESQQLISGMHQQLTVNTEAVHDDLLNVSSATESLHTQIEDIRHVLERLQDTTESLRTDNRKKT